MAGEGAACWEYAGKMDPMEMLLLISHINHESLGQGSQVFPTRLNGAQQRLKSPQQALLGCLGSHSLDSNGIYDLKAKKYCHYLPTYALYGLMSPFKVEDPKLQEALSMVCVKKI